MNIAKWVFTAVQAIAVIVSLAVSIVAVNAIATEFCDSALDAGISNDTCVSDASNALIPGVAASIGFQVYTQWATSSYPRNHRTLNDLHTPQALLIGIIANRAFAYHTYLLQMDAYNARVQTGQHIKLNQVVVNQ